MKTCNCTIMLTNPNCWKTCPNMREEFPEQYDNTSPWVYPDPNKYNNHNNYKDLQKRRVKSIRTIEKFDMNGKFIGKEIITEEEFFDVVF